MKTDTEDRPSPPAPARGSGRRPSRSTHPCSVSWLLLTFTLALTACKPEPQPAASQLPQTSATVQPARAAADIFHACQLCHSTREIQRGPILDGLPAWSVELQLRKFRDGIRGRNETNKSELLMGAGESILHDDDEIRRVAAHIASLPAQKHLLTVRADVAHGKALYLTHCGACHGERGEGKPEIKSPPLKTLEDWFQMDQLRKFKSGLRGYDSRDMEGQAMRAAMAAVKVEDFKDITRYICETLAPLSQTMLPVKAQSK